MNAGMERNPFIIAGKIPTEFFCDRKEESERLIGCINNQENVVLISPRRVGKTGLIDFCFDKPVIKNQYITVTVDILHTTSFREFILSFGNAVYKKVAKRSERLLKLFASTLKSLSGSFGYDPIQNTPTFDIKLGDITSPEYTLEEIFDFLENAEQRCIVAIDEFQQIVYYPEKNIEAILRSYVQKAANANFIFAGSERRIMGEMFQSSKRPFFQSATLIPLEPIKLDLYTDFVLSHFKAVGKGVLPETVKKVYDGF
jgi:AAA+ ATPase superfamily predicted ATPase